MVHRMSRRTAMFGAASLFAAAPFEALAQDGGRIPKIGILSGRITPIEHGFRLGMRDLGYIEGRNVEYVVRNAKGASDRLPEFAAELAALKVHAIFAMSSPSIAAARQATDTIPIVFTMLGDPVAKGWVQSYARPGGNLSGVVGLSQDLAEKRLELLKLAVPDAARMAVLMNPDNPIEEQGVRELTDAGRQLGVVVRVFEARNAAEIDPAFAAMAAWRTQGLLVLPDVMFAAEPQRGQIVRRAAQARLPALYVENDWITAGGLMSYAPNLSEMGRRCAALIDAILKGTKVAELPVELPSKFELYLNLKTANALGLAIPQTILIRADRVIE